LHEPGKVRVQVGFSLEVERKVKRMGCHLVDKLLVQLLADSAGGAGKRAESAGAFGAAQVTGSSGFDRQVDGFAKVKRFLQPARQVVTDNQQGGVNQFSK